MNMISERMLFIDIQRRIEEIISEYICEIADENTLSNMKSDIIQYLEPYRHYGSIYDFLVDYTINANDVDENVFPIINIWIKPTLTTEYRRIQCMMGLPKIGPYKPTDNKKSIKIELQDELFQL